MTNFDIHAAMVILRETMPRFEQPLIEAMGAAIAILRGGLEGGRPSKKGGLVEGPSAPSHLSYQICAIATNGAAFQMLFIGRSR